MDFEDVCAVLTVIIIIAVIVIAILQPKFEADTYTRLTGKKVGYWDAVWCDLRIQEQVK
jgi:hypothetical protein